jgi:uncharacterized protein (DUF1330 family)
MKAYWIARSVIHDLAQYKQYTDRVASVIASYDGRILARGGRYQTMEGPDRFRRFVVIEFPSLERAVACFESPGYAEAASFRRSGAGEVETVIVEGLPEGAVEAGVGL